MIEVIKLSKSFDQDTPIKDLNLQIKEGEFIALVGPSGSGKSTLLHLIGGLDQPSSGQIKVNKKNIHQYCDKKLSQYRNQNIGFVFQEFYLEKFLTVKENILLPTHFNNKKVSAKYLDKILTEVALNNKADSKVNSLSGGQKQRVAIARALINKPKIILADEPTGNLDEKTGQQIIKLLKNIHKNHGSTIVIATHDHKIAKAADRIIKTPLC